MDHSNNYGRFDGNIVYSANSASNTNNTTTTPTTAGVFPSPDSSQLYHHYPPPPQPQHLPHQHQHQLPPPPPPPPAQAQQQQQQAPTTRRTTRARANTQQQAYQNISPAVKREGQQSSRMSPIRSDSKDGVVASSSGAGASGTGHHEDPMPSTSDFVKKLYKCLPFRCFWYQCESF